MSAIVQLWSCVLIKKKKQQEDWNTGSEKEKGRIMEQKGISWTEMGGLDREVYLLGFFKSNWTNLELFWKKGY